MSLNTYDGLAMTSLDGLGKAVRSLRLRRGMAQGGLARAAGIDQSNLSKYEAGGRLPDLAILERLLDALGEDLVGLGLELRRLNGKAGSSEALAVLHEEIQAALLRAGWKPEEKKRRGRGTLARDRK